MLACHVCIVAASARFFLPASQRGSPAVFEVGVQLERTAPRGVPRSRGTAPRCGRFWVRGDLPLVAATLGGLALPLRAGVEVLPDNARLGAVDVGARAEHRPAGGQDARLARNRDAGPALSFASDQPVRETSTFAACRGVDTGSNLQQKV